MTCCGKLNLFSLSLREFIGVLSFLRSCGSLEKNLDLQNALFRGLNLDQVAFDPGLRFAGSN